MHTLPLNLVVALLSGLISATAVPVVHGRDIPSPLFSDVTVFVPPADYNDPRTLYARTAELPNGDLLATWENYSPEPPLVYFPIYLSQDGGESWKPISKVEDQVNGFGLRYQPFLYVLPTPIGAFSAGTVLLAGNSIPTLLNTTHIDLYASTDNGYSWSFVSHIAAGGEAVPDNGLTPVWEPFLMLYQNQMICYYSDQRDPAHGQKLTHQISSDLKTWQAPVDDVAYAEYTARPGMTTVSHLPNGSYIMTYEYGTALNPAFQPYGFPAYYRTSDSPLTFASATGYPVISQDGTQPQSSPYNVWSPIGGKDGSIIVSTGTHSEVFVNTDLGAPGSWEKVATPEGVSYSRHLRVLEQNENHLLIMGAGILPPANGTNKVTVSVVKIDGTLP
jgi:hypothetical protein